MTADAERDETPVGRGLGEAAQRVEQHANTTAATPHESTHHRCADLKPHPLALRIPEMLRDEYVGLVADIQAHGLRLPITLFDGQILDGRHRARACVELSIEPKVENFTGTAAEAWAFVQSINAHRRHLTLDQKRKIIESELQRDPVLVAA